MITVKPQRNQSFTTHSLNAYIKRNNLNITVCKRYRKPVWFFHGEHLSMRVSKVDGLFTMVNLNTAHKVTTRSTKEALEYILNHFAR